MLKLIQTYMNRGTEHQLLNELIEQKAMAEEDVRKSYQNKPQGLAFIRSAERAAQTEGLDFLRSGYARLNVEGTYYSAGRFDLENLTDLAGCRKYKPNVSGGLWFLRGQHPVSDIGFMQATAISRTTYQVASQFNALEALNPNGIVLPSQYVHDPTQGPRASVSAFPSTLLRHFAAPGRKGRFVQDEDRQLNLLAAVCKSRVASMQNGYLLARNISNPTEFVNLLEKDFGRLQVGLHEDAEVVLGANFFGPVHTKSRIAQVFTSTIALGKYGKLPTGTTWSKIPRLLLRASYLGTLLAAKSIKHHRVVLTLIGGGVFKNKPEHILDAIVYAYDEVNKTKGDTLVVVNARDSFDQIGLEKIKKIVQKRNGGIVDVDRTKLLA